MRSLSCCDIGQILALFCVPRVWHINSRHNRGCRHTKMHSTTTRDRCVEFCNMGLVRVGPVLDCAGVHVHVRWLDCFCVPALVSPMLSNMLARRSWFVSISFYRSICLCSFGCSGVADDNDNTDTGTVRVVVQAQSPRPAPPAVHVALSVANTESAPTATNLNARAN